MTHILIRIALGSLSKLGLVPLHSILFLHLLVTRVIILHGLILLLVLVRVSVGNFRRGVFGVAEILIITTYITWQVPLLLHRLLLASSGIVFAESFLTEKLFLVSWV